MKLNKTLPKNWNYIFCVLFGAYVATVLWITLFSRIGSEYRSFQFPFQSYISIFKGSWRSLAENIGNILLFVPLGFALGTLKRLEWKRNAMLGFIVSLFIELLQLILALGTFECDDLLHNTLGVVAGYRIAQKTDIKITIQPRRIRIAVMAFAVAILLPFGYQAIQYQHMEDLAGLCDRTDGTKNLLVLNGKDGYCWDTDVHVKYFKDGSIRISGTADKRSWWSIGKLTLKPGTYVFSGLSAVKENSVALYLEKDNGRFTADVGPNDDVEFTVDEESEFIAYITVYEGCDCDVTARPVIYKEE